MGLLESLEKHPPPRKKIAAILLELEEDERVAVFEALGSTEWPHQAIADVLTDSGHPVSEASVRRYRKGLQ